MNTGDIFDGLKRDVPAVTGVGYGVKFRNGKRTGERGITVFVREKKPKYKLKPGEVIPPKIEGEWTDVQRGDFRALPTMLMPTLRPLAAPLTRHVWTTGADRKLCYRAAVAGVSLGHPSVTAGTIGGWVFVGSKRYILSNNHVMAACNTAQLGDAIWQPGAYDAGGPDEAVATLAAFHPINFAGGENSIDCAIAEEGTLYPDEAKYTPIVADLTSKLRYITSPGLGMPTTKSGRTSGITEGPVDIVNLTCDVSYGQYGVARYINQFGMAVDNYMLGGDSGSIIYQKPEDGEPNTAIGLGFAGTSDGWGIANPISLVFAEFGLSLAVPIRVSGVVTLTETPTQGAVVLFYNETTGALYSAVTNELGHYSITVGMVGDSILVSAHLVAGLSVYEQSKALTIWNEEGETLDFAVSAYDAIANGQTVNFRFAPIDWLLSDLNLEQYLSVWQ